MRGQSEMGTTAVAETECGSKRCDRDTQTSSTDGPWELRVCRWSLRASQEVLEVKTPPANARGVSSSPVSGRSPGGRRCNPRQYSCLENPGTEGPGGLQSTGSRGVGHKWGGLAHVCLTSGFHSTLTLPALSGLLLLLHLCRPWKHSQENDSDAPPMKEEAQPGREASLCVTVEWKQYSFQAGPSSEIICEVFCAADSSIFLSFSVNTCPQETASPPENSGYQAFHTSTQKKHEEQKLRVMFILISWCLSIQCDFLSCLLAAIETKKKKTTLFCLGTFFTKKSIKILCIYVSLYLDEMLLNISIIDIGMIPRPDVFHTQGSSQFKDSLQTTCSWKKERENERKKESVNLATVNKYLDIKTES